MRNLLVLAFLFAASLSYATEIKLQCNMTSVTRSSYDVEKEQGVATIDILELPKFRSIIIDSGTDSLVNSVSAGGSAIPRRLSTSDFSDANKWDITNINSSTNPNISKRESNIIINRLNGQVISKSTTTFNNGSSIDISASGFCVKLDMTKKKF